MKRDAYFIAALQAGLHRRKAWVISAFAMTQEAPDAYQQDPYAYRLVQSPAGTFYVNPDDAATLVPLQDAEPSQAPFFKDDRLTLQPGDLPNLYNDPVDTTYGIALANAILLVYPFDNKFPYINGKMMPSMLEELILPRLVDDLKPGEPIPKAAPSVAPIYVQEYLKFTNAMTYISGFANLWVTGGTRKTLLPPPGLKEFKAAMFAKYGLDPNAPTVDPTKVAQVAAELKQYDQAWLKGDDALNFLIGSKVDVTRAKKFLMVGAEAGLGDGQDMELIPNSLAEGWDVDKMPAMINNLRAGSFNRGAETMRGGEAVKWLQRASSNINILPGDCGTKKGLTVRLTQENRKKYLNFSALVKGPGLVTVRLTEDVIDQYIGQTLVMRSPMYCILPHTDYCATCVGPRLEENPTGSSSAISEFGSTIMLMFMKANHGKALLLKKYDYKARIL